jgi:hypothetical protein
VGEGGVGEGMGEGTRKNLKKYKFQDELKYILSLHEVI